MAILLGGGIACGMFPAVSWTQDTQDKPTTVYHRDVHRMGEDSKTSIAPGGKSMGRSPYAYSGSSFSSQAYKEATSAKMKAAREPASGGDGAPNTAKTAALPEKNNPPPNDNAKPATEPAKSQPLIVHNVYPSGLAAELIAQMKAEYKYIATLDRLRSSGKLGETEIKKLQDALNDASIMMFSAEERSNGFTLQIYLYGVNIVMRPESRQKLDKLDLTSDEAHILATDYCRMLWLRVVLNDPDTRDDDRAAYQVEYNNLLNKHFVLQTKAKS